VLGEYAMPSLENGITKEDLKIFTEEIIHQFHVSIEGVRDEGRRLAEDVARVNKRLETTRGRRSESLFLKFPRTGVGVALWSYFSNNLVIIYSWFSNAPF
jgi:hypothetical protein